MDDVLAAFVPDFARAESTEAERAGLVKAVVEAITLVHRRAADLVRVWQRTHRGELDRRRDQERFRGSAASCAWWCARGVRWRMGAARGRCALLCLLGC